MHKRLISFSFISLFAMALLCKSQESLATLTTSEDLTKLTIEDLMNVKLYSASKKPELIFDTAAAISVITSEDIRRSGATSIPELLRMVPGMTVQKIDSNTWDVSARGFTGSIYANKLLVMIDGRSVYTPLYGGIFLDIQDVVLEDIERIEVIRGPGGTLWGANAVNGVVNVIMKKARDTQGTLVSVGGGTEERGFGTLRYGGQTGDWMYRAYGKYLNRDQGFRHDSLNVDDWDLASGGFRAEKDKLTIHGDFYNGNVGQRTNRTIFDNPPTYALSEYVDVQGWNLFTKYQDEDWSLQGYWDVTKRDISSYGERRDKFDTEYTRILHATARQEIIWGVGSRVEFEDVKNTNDIRISETAQTDYSVNFFAQDEIQAFDERMKIIIGSKLEYNIYTHLEVQPNIRVLYHLNDNNQVWAAASRAVRTPTRIQTDSEITIYSPTLGYVRILGEQDLSSEDLASYELGYRTQPNKKMFFDLSFYANHYKDLVVYNTRDTIDVNGFSVRTFPFVNGMEGVVHGVELSGDVILQEWWKVKAYYALSKMSLGTNPNLPNLGVERLLEGGAPVQSAYLRSSFDLPYAIEFDSTLRYTDSYNHGAVPSLTELDLNVSKLIKGWQVALVGQNLLRNHHKESNTSLATQVERAGYMKVTRKF